jgi:hypothetical protein
MGANRLACLLLLYVALDFANPLITGAVSFVAGVVESVHADRARAPEDLTSVPPPSAMDLATGRQAPEHLAPSLSGLRPAAWQWMPPIRRLAAPEPVRPAAADDH